MASSGSFNTNAYSNRYLTFSWSVASQSVANNQTTINWSLKGAGSASGFYISGNFKVVIDGSTVYSSATRIDLYNGTTVASGTYTFTHNNAGAKSFSASAEAGIYTVAVNCRGSGSWDLPTIPRYPSLTSFTVSKRDETSFTFNWVSGNTIDYVWYSTNNGSNWTGVDVADGTSGSFVVSGLSPNTTYNCKIRIRRKVNQLTTDSSTYSQTTYNYPYCTSMPNFTIGNQLTLGFYNPLKRSISVIGYASNGTTQIFSGSTTGTSLTGFNDSASVNSQYASIPSAKSGTYKVKVTYGSSNITKTGGTYSINTSACTPTIGSLTYQDTNSTTTAITNNNQQIIRNNSVVRYTASNLSVKNSATISSVKLSVNSTTYTLSVSGTTATGGNATIDSASNVSATVTLTDSRGLTATKSVTITMLDWVLPNAIITLNRHNNFYSATDITVDANYSSLDNKNTIDISYAYKKVSDTSYSQFYTLQDNVTTTNTFNNNYDWNIRVKLTDKLGTTYYNLVLPKGMPIIYFDRLKSSTGFNCFPQNEKSVEVDGTNIYKSIFYTSGDSEILTLNSSSTNRMILSGMLTNSAKEFWFTIPMPKNMANVTPSLSVLKVNVRKANGGYLLSSSIVSGGYDVLNDSNMTVTCVKSLNNLLTIEVANTTAWSDVTNNTPVVVTIENLQVNFS